jgi:lysophospholipase L1-like esterase
MESECISDHSHPNDLGYQKMATGIGKLLIDILEINI